MALDDAYGDVTGGDALSGRAEAHELYPTEQEFMADQQGAVESFALYPIITIGPILEASGEHRAPRRRLTEWYGTALKGLLGAVEPHHDDSCYDTDGGSLDTVRCEKREICPLRVCERYFSDMMRMAVESTNTESVEVSELYNSVDYLVDPERTYDIAMARLAVGQSTGVLLKGYASTQRERYEEWFSARYPLDETNVKLSE